MRGNSGSVGIGMDCFGFHILGIDGSVLARLGNLSRHPQVRAIGNIPERLENGGLHFSPRCVKQSVYDKH